MLLAITRVRQSCFLNDITIRRPLVTLPSCFGRVANKIAPLRYEKLRDTVGSHVERHLRRADRAVGNRIRMSVELFAHGAYSF